MKTESDQNPWTEEQLAKEFEHRMETRLGMMCGADEPDADQIVTAINEAEESVDQIREQERIRNRPKRKMELDL